MFMMRQGDISNAKRVDELEKRVEMLENVVKQLQLSERPKVGRPAKVKDEPSSQQERS
jgi:tetrahydromethanopterin S-methyltransferase subunit G